MHFSVAVLRLKSEKIDNIAITVKIPWKLFAVSSPQPSERARNIKIDGRDNVYSAVTVEQHGDHIYEVEEKILALRCTPVIACNDCIKLNSTVIDFKKKLRAKEKKIVKLKSELEGSKI